jgi:putative transposase
MAKSKTPNDPFRWFDSSPEVIRLVVMMYVRYPLSLRNVEDLLFERGIDICHETVRLWWNRFGPMFAGEIRRKPVRHMRAYTHWRWHLNDVYVRVGGEMRYFWRAIDHEGEVLESYVTKPRDKAAALKFIKKALRRHGRPKAIVTDGLRSYKAALKVLGAEYLQAPIGRRKNNRADNSHLPFRRRERAMARFRRMKIQLRCTPRSTTTSARSATSSDAKSTSRDAPPPWPSGGPSWAKASLGLGSLRPTGDKSTLV